jgi:hypothetical protein
MKFASRLLVTAGLALTLAAPAFAQGHGRMPLFSVAQWVEVEDGYNAVWTFEPGSNRQLMDGVWVNNSTGRRTTARRMRVSIQGQQVVIARGHLGNYVGTIAPAGDEISGTMSWSSSRFTAHIKQ